MSVAMFGGLHMEIAMWMTYGDYLEGSGWTNALTQAGIASFSTADSFLKASHLTRTRHAHQVTALVQARTTHIIISMLSMKTWVRRNVNPSPCIP